MGIFGPEKLSSVLAHFWLTLATELAVIALVVHKTRRSSRLLSALGCRLATEKQGNSGLWCLPFYVWAWQANLFLAAMVYDPSVLSNWPIHEAAVVMLFHSLFYLLLLQTIGTTMTNDAPATLGLTGYHRTAAILSMLSVFLNVALFLYLLREGVLPYGLTG
jgi:hypothetical protein